MKKALLPLLLLGLSSQPVFADWQLDADASSLNFISTKANTAAEVHRFNILEGSVDANGDATLTVDLASVDTAIEIRDQRMREQLFEVDRYPTATLATRVDMTKISQLAAGDSVTIYAQAQLSLHDTETSHTLVLEVLGLRKDRLLVISKRPVVVNAGQVGLLGGIEKLREIAGLTSISPAVPVTFALYFDGAD